MIEYKVVVAKDISELQSQVNLLLSNGWNLQGGVSLYKDKINKLWSQALVFK